MEKTRWIKPDSNTSQHFHSHAIRIFVTGIKWYTGYGHPTTINSWEHVLMYVQHMSIFLKKTTINEWTDILIPQELLFLHRSTHAFLLVFRLWPLHFWPRGQLPRSSEMGAETGTLFQWRFVDQKPPRAAFWKTASKNDGAANCRPSMASNFRYVNIYIYTVLCTYIYNYIYIHGIVCLYIYIIIYIHGIVYLYI